MRETRGLGFIGVAILVMIIIGMIGHISHRSPTVMTMRSNYSRSGNGGASNASYSNTHSVPWDYKVEQKKVGDLVGGDMVILPGDQMLPNDDNYATGDKIWVLSYMSAQMSTNANGSTNMTLSEWKPLKSFRSKDDASTDLKKLKEEIQTDVPLVGVYKTENKGKYRQFAVITLPTGNAVKQPITEKRYEQMQKEKQVKVNLEEVHSYENYDDSMAKFRGWAS